MKPAKKIKQRLCISILLLACASSSLVQAQTTGTVYSSVITPQEQAFEYRAAFVPASGNADSRFGNHLHYQRAFRDDLRWRGIIQGSDSRNGSLRFDFLQAELLWQFKHNRTDGWDSALRFDARISDSDLADQLGSNARSGVSIESRERVSYRLQSGSVIALEMFNVYGRSTGFGDFDAQKHRIGPNFSGRLSSDWSFSLGMIFGLSDAASDVDVRATLIKAL